jgi:hypothetical protein
MEGKRELGTERGREGEGAKGRRDEREGLRDEGMKGRYK